MHRRISAAMCSRGRTLGDPRLSPDGTTVGFVAGSAGQVALTLVPSGGGPETVLTTEPSIRRASASGSGTWDWLPDGRAVVYVASTGGLWFQDVAGGPPRGLLDPGWGAVGSPAVSPDGSRVACTIDDRHVVVAWTDPDGPWPVRVSTGGDFVVDPVWDPSGARLAWHAWDVPAMAWDHSVIVLADAPGSDGASAGVGGRTSVVDLPGPSSVGQPRFSPIGDRIGFLCDVTGWSNLWVADPDGSRPRPLVTEEFEHGTPTWGGGQHSWTWSPDGASLAFCRNEGGFGRLCVADVTSLRVRELDRGWFTGLSWASTVLAGVRSGARTPDQIVVHDPAAPAGAAPVARRSLVRGPVAGFEAADPIEPEPVVWPSADLPGVGTTVHGRLSRTRHPAGGAVAPLVVWVHGGPTGQTPVTFNARLSFLLDRGWNVLQVDPRGSTGWGRSYAQALAGGWGEIDVEDVASGIRAAGSAGWGDPERTVIMGGSSGGLVVLGVLTRHPGLCAAGVDLYGVTDLFDLDGTTTRWEAHYPASLIGPLPAAAPAYRERSPINRAGRISAPLLVLHGRDDRSVPLAQSEALVSAVSRAGGVVEYHWYEGEGHGWSRPETTRDELERIDAFLTRRVLRGRRT